MDVLDTGEFLGEVKRIFTYAYAKKGIDFSAIASKLSSKVGEDVAKSRKWSGLLKEILKQEVRAKRLKKKGEYYYPVFVTSKEMRPTQKKENEKVKYGKLTTYWIG